MAISESQLETWSNQGAIAIAKSTHESIRNAILSDSKLKDRNFEVYLQGSYRNSTNTWGDSDVDVVIQLSDVFVSDTSSLTENQRTLFRIRYSDSTYHWEDFRSDVLKALREYYGEENIDEGNKSLKLKKTPGRLAADIVPCLQYRLYHPCSELTREDYTEGIWFRERDNNRSIVNYPKEHYNNGVNKNSDEKTGGLFKPTVRLFKNVRAYLLDRDSISKDLAPSYFIQCLLYNVPDKLFCTSYQETYYNILNWLLDAPLSSFVCQNGVLPLFGNTPEQWSIEKAQKLRHALIKLWNEW